MLLELSQTPALRGGNHSKLLRLNRYYEKVGSEVKDITDDLPFEIPDSWVWVRLSCVVDFSQSDTVAVSQDASRIELSIIYDSTAALIQFIEIEKVHKLFANLYTFLNICQYRNFLTPSLIQMPFQKFCHREVCVILV